jgi:protein-S-isoprenylcysteine O-methyltransferase Ste14
MKEKNGEHPFGDTGQLILLVLFLVVWAADSFFLSLSTFPADYLPRYIRLTLLVASLLVAALLTKSGHVVVSHERRPSGLITTGAFKYVRHPLYLSCLLVYLGLVLSTASLVSLVLWVIICIFYNYLAGYEEKLLESKYGEDYRIYREKTGKWLPMLGRLLNLAL